MLSELEESVLRAIMLGKRKLNKISKSSGIPVILTEKVIERLIERGYLDDELQPTEKAFHEMKWLDREHSFSYYGEDIKRIVTLITDLAIVIAAIVLVGALLLFFT
jgi:hypothetical protein